MSISPRAVIVILFLLSFTILFAGETESRWPAQIETGEWIVTIYQPQTDSFEGDTLEARAAVSVKRADGTGEPAFGAVWLSATLDIDRENRLMTVRELNVPDVRFADAKEKDRAALARLLETEIPKWELTLDLDQMVADLGAASESSTTPGIKSDPPIFLHVTEPSVLLLYDGEPRSESIDGAAGLERIVNTIFPVVREKGVDRYYLFGGEDYWYAAGDPMGPWEVTRSVPESLRDLMRQVEAPEDFKNEDAEKMPPPKIVVATEPTELVITQGEPKWVPIGDLDLLYCDNTDSDVFLDLATQSYYIMVAGRWFAGRAVADRFEWKNVPNDELPEAFSDIPEDSVNAHVLAHVAGTEQAREEALQNTIPQTAAVKRTDNSFSVQYVGEPKLEPVQDLPEVRYAVNTTASVFLTNGQYWACDNAIWYTSPAATGPWVVATEIPATLYRIPASNPHHNVTYVHIYETTPQVVYVGYTPGYVGSYWYRGCVVWGTGWYYNPWYGGHYYPRPWTWGLNVHYNPWYGWSFGVTWSNGPFRITVGHGGGYYGGWGRPGCCGWYGPGGYRPPYYRPYPPPGYSKPRPTPYAPGGANRPSQNPAGPRPATRPANNIYDSPATRDRVASTPSTRDRSRPAQNDSPNNVFTDRSGNVYRKSDSGGWETRDNGRWKPAEGLDRPSAPGGTTGPGQRPAPDTRPSQPSTPGTRPSQPSGPGTRPSTPGTGLSGPSTRPSTGGATRPQLERDSRSRQRGSQRIQQRPSTPRPSRGRR